MAATKIGWLEAAKSLTGSEAVKAVILALSAAMSLEWLKDIKPETAEKIAGIFSDLMESPDQMDDEVMSRVILRLSGAPQKEFVEKLEPGDAKKIAAAYIAIRNGLLPRRTRIITTDNTPGKEKRQVYEIPWTKKELVELDKELDKFIERLAAMPIDQFRAFVDQLTPVLTKPEKIKEMLSSLNSFLNETGESLEQWARDGINASKARASAQVAERIRLGDGGAGFWAPAKTRLRVFAQRFHDWRQLRSDAFQAKRIAKAEARRVRLGEKSEAKAKDREHKLMIIEAKARAEAIIIKAKADAKVVLAEAENTKEV